MAVPPEAPQPPGVALPFVLVTRPQPQADEWVARLRTLGVDAAALPLLGIAGPADPDAVRGAWRRLASPADADAPAVVMFVSPSAVERFFALRPADIHWPDGVIAAGTGPGTRRALRAAGVPEAAVLTPPEAAGQFDSEALWAILRERLPRAAADVLIVRGEGGRDWLADTLRQHGARVHFVEAYRRTVPVPDEAGREALRRALAQPAHCCWLFSSSEAVGHLPALAPGADWAGATALASHPRIAEAARRLGFGRVAQVLPSPEAVALVLRGGAVGGGGPSIQSIEP